jgi:hypothetical protein
MSTIPELSATNLPNFNKTMHPSNEHLLYLRKFVLSSKFLRYDARIHLIIMTEYERHVRVKILIFPGTLMANVVPV